MHCCCCTLILWCCIYKDSFSSLFLCLRIWRRCCLSPLTLGSSCTLSCMPARRSCCSASSPPSLPTLCTTGKRRLHTQLQLSNYGSQSSGQGWNFTCLPLCRWSFRWHFLTRAVVVVFHVHEKKKKDPVDAQQGNWIYQQKQQKENQNVSQLCWWDVIQVPRRIRSVS